MPMWTRIVLTAATLLTMSCKEVSDKNPLEHALASESPLIKNVMDHLKEHEIQIRYTQIDRRNDSIFFTDFDFQVDA